MDYAVSMYGGGLVIMATEANYSTAKELGCKCPLCSEAVFLRAGTIRTNHLRNGKLKDQIVDPAFCHYKGSEMSDCENRIHNQEGKNKLEQFKVKSHNQRLNLYNRHLWEMYAQENNLKKLHFRYIKKLLGRDKIDFLAVKARRYFATLGSDVYRFVEDAFCNIVAVKPKKLKQLKKDYKDIKVPEEATIQKKLLLQQKLVELEHMQKLHLAICCEILEFLGTRTSGYFWRNIVPHIVMASMTTRMQMGKFASLENDWVIKHAEFIFLHETDLIQNLIITWIVSTYWIKQINQKLLKV